MTQAPIPPKREVAIINASSVLDDDVVRAAVPAFQKQVTRDLAPAWGIDAELRFVGYPVEKEKLPASAWWVVILDNPDQAGQRGCHDLTDSGLPLGKVFARTDEVYKHTWTVTASHELLEMLVDPWINLTVFLQPDDKTGELYAYEICDPVESDEWGYEIDGTLVSDFVHPAWFEPALGGEHNGPPASAKPPILDQLTQLRDLRPGGMERPLQVLKGGYIGVFDVSGGTGWHQRTAEPVPDLSVLAEQLVIAARNQGIELTDPGRLLTGLTKRVPETALQEANDPLEMQLQYGMRAPIGSRRERRRIPRARWIHSNWMTRR
jgi:hypothetical protein